MLHLFRIIDFHFHCDAAVFFAGELFLFIAYVSQASSDVITLLFRDDFHFHSIAAFIDDAGDFAFDYFDWGWFHFRFSFD